MKELEIEKSTGSSSSLIKGPGFYVSIKLAIIISLSIAVIFVG